MIFKTLDELKAPVCGTYDRYKREQICDDVSKIYHGSRNINGNECKRVEDLIGVFLGEKDSDPMCLMTMDTFTHHFLDGHDIWKDEVIIRIFPKLEDNNRYYTNGLPRYVTRDVYENMYLKGNDEWLNKVLNFYESNKELDEEMER